jgi:cardiolipin synthase
MLRHDFERGSHRIEEEKFLARPRTQRLKESLLRPLAPLL